MYSVKFHSINADNLRTSSQVLECKRFPKRLLDSPTEKHLYDIRLFAEPIRY